MELDRMRAPKTAPLQTNRRRSKKVANCGRSQQTNEEPEAESYCEPEAALRHESRPEAHLCAKLVVQW
jgi:hypothetical protein